MRRIVFGVLAAGSGGAGIYFNAQAGGYADDQRAIRAQYLSATEDFDALAEEYEKKEEDALHARTLRNVLYGCAGAFGFCCVISIPF